MKETAEAIQFMNPSKPKKKKKEKNNKIISEHKQQLEMGEHYSGYLYKRTGNSWKKKWCELKGCVFSYSKSPNDTSTHDYILLRGDISIVKDAKKPFALKVACKGVKEIYLAADEEEEQFQWLYKMQEASYRDDEFPLLDDTPSSTPQALPEGIYNVPRNLLSQDEALYDLPPPELIIAGGDMVEGVPSARGLYDVPRNLLADNQSILTSNGMEFHLSGNPFDLYDVPRSAMGGSYIDDDDDEGIYDYPLDLDLGDMEIYDYPPDASELGILEETASQSSSGILRESGSDNSSNTPPSGDGTVSSAGSNRQSHVESIGSIEDITYPPMIGDGFHTMPHATSQKVESFLSSIVEGNMGTTSTINTMSYESVSSLEFGQTIIKGVLLRKDRIKWTRSYCIIRNSFLECHKTSASATTGKPLMKLLLLGSQVSPVQDSKRRWVFQLKHPRREGAIVFAAESELDYKRWMDSFQNASSIQVQQVHTMDEIRIQDSDLKRQWRSMEKGLQDNSPLLHQREDQQHNRRGGIGGDSSPTGSDGEGSRKRRLTWGNKPSRSTPTHRRVKSGSGKDINKDNNNKKVVNTVSETDGRRSFKKASSTSVIPTPPREVRSQGSSPHRAISPSGIPCFQGYLHVKVSKEDKKWSRYWCVLEDMKISCHINQKNLTLITNVYLPGTTIAPADVECSRRYSIRIWDSQTLSCTYFSASDEDEYTSWFNEIIKGADKVSSGPNATSSNVVYYFPKDKPDQKVAPSNETTPKHAILELPPGVLLQGILKKRSDKGQWNMRFCRLKESHLYVYYTSSDQTPITVLAIQVGGVDGRSFTLYVCVCVCVCV
jgi:hypothetical protein